MYYSKSAEMNYSKSAEHSLPGKQEAACDLQCTIMIEHLYYAAYI